MTAGQERATIGGVDYLVIDTTDALDDGLAVMLYQPVAVCGVDAPGVRTRTEGTARNSRAPPFFVVTHSAPA